MSATWRGAEPHPLPPLRPGETFRAAVRLAAVLGLTGICVLLFVAGRWLRHHLGHWVSFHFTVAKLWARVGLRLTGIRLVVRGEPICSGALVANHSTWIDILALRSVRLMYFVSKAEVASWPWVGYITRVTGTIFIERRRSHAKRQEDALRDRIAADQLLIFFPEGTSSDGLRVLPFKSSLFSVFFLDGHGAHLLVQPVTVRYRPHPASGLPDSFYGWWGDMDFAAHVWDVLARSRGGAVEVIFHEPARPDTFSDRKALADWAGATVARGMTEGRVIARAAAEV